MEPGIQRRRQEVSWNHVICPRDSLSLNPPPFSHCSPCFGLGFLFCPCFGSPVQRTLVFPSCGSLSRTRSKQQRANKPPQCPPPSARSVQPCMCVHTRAHAHPLPASRCATERSSMSYIWGACSTTTTPSPYAPSPCLFSTNVVVHGVLLVSYPALHEVT